MGALTVTIEALAGIDLAVPTDCDIEADEPGYYSVARLRFPTHTLYEFRVSDRCEHSDANALLSHLPIGATYQGCETVAPGTLGTDTELVVTYRVEG